MQRWEYLSVELAWDEATGQWDADGERAAEDLGHVLATYGADGWDLVAFAPDRWVSTVARPGPPPPDADADPWEVEVYRAVFKRPAPP